MNTRFVLALSLILTTASFAEETKAPNPYCIGGGNWSPTGIMKTLDMPGGAEDLNGCLTYNWGTFTPQTRLALTNPTWRWTTYDRKPPWHAYDVKEDKIVNPDKLKQWVTDHPGWYYIIGNEPDNPKLDAGDGMTPEQYARMFNKYYTFIKPLDETAVFVIGAPYAASYRHEVTADAKYWNTSLTYYKEQFGTDMEVDVWNCHCYTPPGHLNAERIIHEFFIPYREFVDTVSGGIYKDKPLWCTEFGIAEWSGLASPEYMAEFAAQLCPRLEKTYRLRSGETKRVCDRFFWFLGPWSKKWADSAMVAEDKTTPTIVGKTYSKLANNIPNKIPAIPSQPQPAEKSARFDFDKTADPWRPMAGHWSIHEGTYRQTRRDDGWGIRSHLPDWYEDVNIETQIKIIETADDNNWAGIRFRHSTIWTGLIRGYLVYIRKNGDVGLSTTGRKEPFVSKEAVIKNTSTFHRLNIRAVGPQIKISIDGILVIDWTDPKPHRQSGLVSLETGNADACFDNVVVTPLAKRKAALTSDDRHAIVATDTGGWGGPNVPMQGPQFFDAIGMKWWYEYRNVTTPTNTFKGYSRLYMYWRANLNRKAEQIQADAKAAAEAYPGQTVYWAISNEPNEKGQANQKAKDYAAIYYHYHRNLKIGDPKCKIMGAGILNWDHQSTTVFQRGKDWYEEFRNTWHANEEWRAYSQDNYKVAYPPQDVFNFHAYDLRGVAGVPFAPEDWRYSRDQIEMCYKDILEYPEVLNKKIWLTEFGALRAPNMESNIALSTQLVGWMRDQPYIERWFWFIIHSDKYGGWPQLELLTEDGQRTALGDAALELASLPRSAKVVPVNHAYANNAPPQYIRKDSTAADTIQETAKDHPYFALTQNTKLVMDSMAGRMITAEKGQYIRKVTFLFRSNYDPAEVRLIIDSINDSDEQKQVWENAAFGSKSGRVELKFTKKDKVRSIGIGMIAMKDYTYPYPTGEWLGEIKDLIIVSE